MKLPAWTLQAGAATTLALLSASCVIEGGTYYRHGRDRADIVVATTPPPPPQVVYVAPPPPPQAVTVYEAPPEPVAPVIVSQAPPPVMQEVVPVAPAPGFVWIGGSWMVYRGQWVWVRGRWERPPHPGAHWEPQHWERHGAQFELRVGGWR